MALPGAAGGAESDGGATAVTRAESDGGATAVTRAESDGGATAVTRAESDGGATAVTRAESDGGATAVTGAESDGGATAVTGADSELDEKAAATESGCPIASHIEVKWTRETWYSGVVTKYDIDNDGHYVDYDLDSHEQYEDLKTIRWRFVEGQEPAVDASKLDVDEPPEATSML